MESEKVQSGQGTPGADCIQFYTLESYLFNTVHPRFAEQGYLGAFDFFCIVIWKANRAKTKVAKRLLGDATKTLDEVVVDLTRAIAAQKTPKDRMRLLMFGDIRFRLPMASAILTVLYPDEFTVYDYRVCESLGGFRNLTNLKNIDRLWERYSAFKSAVISNSPAGLSLRDSDRYLWGKSFHDQLANDVATTFRSTSEDEGLASADAVEGARRCRWGRTMSEKWLEEFKQKVADCWEWHSPALQISFSYTKPDQDDDFWEVWVYPALQEIVGGKEDGETVWAGFDFDVLEFLNDFEPEAVGISTRQPSHPSEMTFEGKFRGQGVFLHLCLEPPDDAEPTEILDLSGNGGPVLRDKE